jgi:hypothetical protein
MKNFTLLLFSFLFAIQIAQAQEILSVEIIPAEPTSIDTIKIIITNVFPSGDCDGTVEYNQFENSILASSLHCLGFLTVICYDVDTIVLNPLPQGQYNFVYILSSGFGPPGECTPGIVPDDTEAISFSVSPPLNVNELQALNFSAFPNPVKNNCTVLFESMPKGKNTLNVFDAIGRTILELPVLNSNSIQFNTSDLAPGLYFLQISDEGSNKSNVLRLVKE